LSTPSSRKPTSPSPSASANPQDEGTESLIPNESPGPQEDESKYQIRQSGKTWDLSKLNFEKLKEEFHAAPRKNIEIADLRAPIQKKPDQMMKQNLSRVDFPKRLQNIIDRYNSGSSSADNYFAEPVQFTKELQAESTRHIAEGLTEDELELFDLIKKDKMTKDETQKVRLAAKSLLHRLREESPKSWFKIGKTTTRPARASAPKSKKSSTKTSPPPSTAPASPKNAPTFSKPCSTTPPKASNCRPRSATQPPVGQPFPLLPISLEEANLPHRIMPIIPRPKPRLIRHRRRRNQRVPKFHAMTSAILLQELPRPQPHIFINRIAGQRAEKSAQSLVLIRSRARPKLSHAHRRVTNGRAGIRQIHPSRND
jgi:hypothetical protein